MPINCTYTQYNKIIVGGETLDEETSLEDVLEAAAAPLNLVGLYSSESSHESAFPGADLLLLLGEHAAGLGLGRLSLSPLTHQHHHDLHNIHRGL